MQFVLALMPEGIPTIERGRQLIVLLAHGTPSGIVPAHWAMNAVNHGLPAIA